MPVTAGWTSSLAAIAAGGVSLAIVLSKWRVARETTLLGAWWWTLTALVVWTGAHLLCRCLPVGWMGTICEPLELAAISLSFCPVVAVIGAKRPQHLAWSFVVLALLGIVALPAAESLALRPGVRIHISDARSVFLWILIALGPINFFPTRYWLAALFVAGGQVVALAPQLVLLRRDLVDGGPLAGLVLCGCAMVCAQDAYRRPRNARSAHDRLWLDFRDSFGLFWGLRLQERVNAAARQAGWDLELSWSGFVRPSDGANLATLDPAVEPALRTSMRGLLRRFVSNEWIAERWKSPLD